MNENASTAVGDATEERALSLLASGIEPAVVAAALGVSVSRISQIVSEPAFAARLQEAKFTNLQKHNERDNNYDTIEDKLIKKLDNSLPFIMKPGEILGAIRVINAAKRRGISAPEHVNAQQTVVQLTMPVMLVQKFTTNIHNQVVTAGQQDLVTIGSKNLDSLAAQMQESVRMQKLVDYAGASRESAARTLGAGNERVIGSEEIIDI